MIYILLIIIIILLLGIRKNIVNHRTNCEQIDLTHLYAMLSIVPHNFSTKAQRDFYIETYQRKTPMFYSARFQIALDVEKFFQSEAAKDLPKEHREEILSDIKKEPLKYIENRSVDVIISNSHASQSCLYAGKEIYGIALRVYADKNKIELPFVGFIAGATNYFDFQHWIDREIQYHRYQKWQENAKNIPPWHIPQNGEWKGWRVCYEEDSKHSFPPYWYLEKEYIQVWPSIEIWDRCGRNVKEYNLEDELPAPLQEEIKNNDDI